MEIIQVLLTILGWLVAGAWAIRQVDLAHKKNRELQLVLIQDSHRRGLAKDLMENFSAIANSIGELKNAVFHFLLNYTLENNRGLGDGISVSARSLIEPINVAYGQLNQHIYRLEMWLRITGDEIAGADAFGEAIRTFRRDFAIPDVEQKGKLNNWLDYQQLFAQYQSEFTPAVEQFAHVSGEINSKLSTLQEALTDGTKAVSKNLLDLKSLNK